MWNSTAIRSAIEIIFIRPGLELLHFVCVSNWVQSSSTLSFHIGFYCYFKHREGARSSLLFIRASSFWHQFRFSTICVSGLDRGGPHNSFANLVVRVQLSRERMLLISQCTKSEVKAIEITNYENYKSQNSWITKNIHHRNRHSSSLSGQFTAWSLNS